MHTFCQGDLCEPQKVFFYCNVLKTKKHYILEVYYITKQVHDFHVASTVLFLDNI